MLKKKLEANFRHHERAVESCTRLASKYLSMRDFNEAARWADAAKCHRFTAEVLKGLLAL